MRQRLKDVWPFGKPKTPGFGISANFYLSVLASVARMPPVVAIVNPHKTGDAVEGFGAPLVESNDKAELAQPMHRGAYVLAAKDRKTVLKMLVMPKDEAGFNPDAFLNNPLSAGIPDEMAARIRATWTLCQLTYESHDPMVYPALDFMLDIAQRLAQETDGVIADPISQTYKLPEELRAPNPPDARIDARNFVTVQFRVLENGVHAFTLGMQKFALPEFEIYGLDPGDENSAGPFLIGLCQTVLAGNPMSVQATIGARNMPFTVAPGGLDRGIWEGIACYELIPPTGNTASEAVSAWTSTL